MDELLKYIDGMAPEVALSRVTQVLERLLADLDRDSRQRFLVNLIGQSENDKVAGLVHL